MSLRSGIIPVPLLTLGPCYQDEIHSCRMTTYLVFGIIVLLVLIGVSISITNRARSVAVQNKVLPEDELIEFRKMRNAGEISEEEFRKMKKIIADKIVEQAKGE